MDVPAQLYYIVTGLIGLLIAIALIIFFVPEGIAGFLGTLKSIFLHFVAYR